MLSLNSLLLSSEAPKKLAGFYRQVLASDLKWQEGDYPGFEAGPCALIIGPHSQVHGQNKNPERIMFNLETTDVKGDFKRLKGLGVKVVAEPYTVENDRDFWIATLADPDGNYFQLNSPMKK